MTLAPLVAKVILNVTMRALSALILTLVLIYTASPLSGRGATAASSQTVILVDISVGKQSEETTALSKSVLGLLTTLKTSPSLSIGTFAQEVNLVGPLPSTSPEISVLTGEVIAELDALSSEGDSNLSRALLETLNFLSSEGASSGSSIYLISGGVPSPLPGEQRSQVRSLLDSFQEKGWRVNTIALPEPSGEGKGFLESVAMATGGAALEASFPQGLKALADKLLQDAGEVSLVSLSQGNLERSQLLSSTVTLAPRTQEATILFLKEAPSTAVRLFDPSGIEAASASQGVADVVETPLVVIWRLQDPQPGEWRANIQGEDGRVFAWHQSVNLIQPYLESHGALPMDEPTIISASIREGSARLTLDNIELYAQVTSPSGSKAAYELNDTGINGDRAAGDGYYSIRIPPVAEQGSYQVTLELVWPDYPSTLSSQSQFRVEPFPQATIDMLPAQEMEIGKPTRIATITVHIQDEHYPVAQEQLNGSVSLFDGTIIPVELAPGQVFGEGRAWTYYATITPQKGGQHNLNLSLQLNYLGRDYIYFAQPLLIDVPLPPPAPIAETPGGGFPSWVMVLIGILATLILLWSLSWLLRTRPYGYLYDDQGIQVVDFGQIRRSLLQNVLFKSSVWGSETGIPGLERVLFHFNRGRVQLSYNRPTSTVRVNNQPVTDRADLVDRSWIGAQGKLTMFLSSHPASSSAFAAGEQRSITETP